MQPTGVREIFQFLHNLRQHNACEQAELILQAALDPTIASRAKKGQFVMCFDHFDLLQTAINWATMEYRAQARVRPQDVMCAAGWKRRYGAIWQGPVNVEASAGSGGGVDGSMTRWDSLTRGSAPR
jgi:hypothetical protein